MEEAEERRSRAREEAGERRSLQDDANIPPQPGLNSRHVPRRIRPEPDALRSEILPSEVEKNYRKYLRRESGAEPVSSRPTFASQQTPPPDSPQAFMRRAQESIKTELGKGHVSNAYARLCAYADQAPPAMVTRHLHKARKDGSFDQDLNPVHQSDESNPRPDMGAWLVKTILSPRDRDISQLVTVFLTLYPVLVQDSAVQPIALASRLFDTATEAASLAAINSLFRWLSNRDALTAGHLRLLVLHSPTLCAKVSSEEASSFYTNLFETRLPEIQDLALFKLMITAAMLDSHTHSSWQNMSIPLSDSAHSSQGDRFVSLLLLSCTKLLAARRHRAAMRLFARCPVQPTSVTDKWQNMAWDLVTRSLQLEYHDESLGILHRMSVSGINVNSNVQDLALVCMEKSRDDTLVELHRRFAPHMNFSQDVNLTIYSLLAVSNKAEAVAVLLRAIQSPLDDSILTMYTHIWPTLLQQRWNTTKNLNDTKQLFNRMCGLAGEDHVDIPLYNAMIRACIDAGQMPEAENVLRQMQAQGVERNTRTFGHFVFAAAQSQDWDAVEKLMGILRSIGDPLSKNHEDTFLFNPVLRMYVQHHDPSETWSFVTRSIEVYGVRPNQATFEIVLEALVHGRGLDLAAQVVVYMQNYDNRFDFDHYAAFRMLRRFYYDSRPSHLHMVWLCRHLSLHIPNLMSEDLMQLLRDAVAYDIRHMSGLHKQRRVQVLRSRLRLLKRVDLNSSVPWHLTDGLSREFYLHDTKDIYLLGTEDVKPPTASLTLDGSSTSSSAVRYTTSTGKSVTPTHRRRNRPDVRESELLISFSLGEHSDAVKLYQDALYASGLPPSSVSLEAAIAASIQAQGGNTVEAEDLLRSAQESGFNISAALLPLLLQRLNNTRDGNSGLELNNLRQSIQDFYRTMADNGIHVRHHLATTTAHILIEQGRSRDAVALLSEIYHSEWTWPSAGGKALDVPAMTVFLQGYIKMNHEEGMKWVIDCILEKDMRIDTALLETLKRAREHFRLAARKTGDAQFARLEGMMRGWHLLCQQRQKEQKKASQKFGLRLVDRIVECARQKTLAPPEPLCQSKPRVSHVVGGHGQRVRKIRIRRLDPAAACRRAGVCAAAQRPGGARLASALPTAPEGAEESSADVEVTARHVYS